MSAHDLVPFSFDGHAVRVVLDQNGDAWFIAADVCATLSIGTEQTRRLDADEKGLRTVQTPGGPQELVAISESGLYSLILTSRKPEAKRFKKWVTSEVLPSIRRTGSYTAPAADPLASLPPEQRALVGVMVDQAALRQQLEVQGAALATVDQRVTDLAENMLVLERPAGSESIVHIRARINKLHGLSMRVVDEIMRQSPLAPKPACMVKSSHAEALGGSYAVYWTKDVNAVFTRFVAECERITPTQAVHPYIDGRFKLASPQRDRWPPGAQSILI